MTAACRRSPSSLGSDATPPPCRSVSDERSVAAQQLDGVHRSGYRSASVSFSMCLSVSRSNPSGLRSRSASSRSRSARCSSLSAGFSAVGMCSGPNASQ